MTNLTENDSFDAGVYEWQTTDQALGGPGGIMNQPPQNLANRTRYLLNRIIDGVLSFVTDSGTAANAIIASYPQTIAALVDGMEVTFRVSNSTTNATTLKLANTGGATLPTLPLYGSDFNALAGGELPAGAIVRAKYNSQLNSGSGAWVVMQVAGGYAKIPTAPSGDSTTKAANMAALYNATDGIATINVSVGADIVLTAAQAGSAILKLTGTPTAAINLVLPAQSGQYVILNQQGGTFNITAKPVGGTGVVLPQTASTGSIVVTDGATAWFASSQAGTLAFTPITIASFTGTTLTVPGGYTPGAIMINKNGDWLQPSDYSATVSPTITLAEAAVSTDQFIVYNFNSFTVANAVQKSGDTMGGALALAAGSTAPTPTALDSSTKLQTTAGANAVGGCAGSSVNLSAKLESASTSVTFTADEIILETALGGAPIRLGSFSQTLNIANTGAGGMDTGTGPASSYVAIYAIYNPSTSTRSIIGQNVGNSVAPTIYAGGNMPSGYTASALLGVWPTNSSNQFYAMLQYGRVHCRLPVQVLSTSTAAASVTTLSISSAVPANSKFCDGYGSVANTVAGDATTISLLPDTASLGGITAGGPCASANQAMYFSFSKMPVDSTQTLYYSSGVSAGSGAWIVYIARYEI